MRSIAAASGLNSGQSSLGPALSPLIGFKVGWRAISWLFFAMSSALAALASRANLAAVSSGALPLAGAAPGTKWMAVMVASFIASGTILAMLSPKNCPDDVL